MADVIGMDNLWGDLPVQPQVMRELARQVVAAGVTQQQTGWTPQRAVARTPASSGDATFGIQGAFGAATASMVASPSSAPPPLIAATVAPSTPRSKRAFGVEESETKKKSIFTPLPREYDHLASSDRTTVDLSAKTLVPDPDAVTASEDLDYTQMRRTLVAAYDKWSQEREPYSARASSPGEKLPSSRSSPALPARGRLSSASSPERGTSSPVKSPIFTSDCVSPVLEHMRDISQAQDQEVDPGSLQSCFPARRFVLDEEDGPPPPTALEIWEAERRAKRPQTEEIRAEAVRQLSELKVTNPADMKLLARFGTKLRSHFKDHMQAFRALTAKHGGMVSRAEFAIATDKFKVYRKEAFDVFKILDAAGGSTGKIGKQELKLAWDLGENTRENEEQLVLRFAQHIRKRFPTVHAAFRAIDADGGGSLSKAEFVAALSHMHWGRYDAECIFSFLDREGGDSGVITRDGFCQLWDLGKALKDPPDPRKSKASQLFGSRMSSIVVEQKEDEGADTTTAQHPSPDASVNEQAASGSPAMGLTTAPPSSEEADTSQFTPRRSPVDRSSPSSTKTGVLDRTECHMQKKVERQRRASEDYEAELQTQGKPSITPTAARSRSCNLEQMSTAIHAMRQEKLERKRQMVEENQPSFPFHPEVTKMAHKQCYGRPDPMGRIALWERQEAERQRKLQERNLALAEEAARMSEVMSKPKIDKRSVMLAKKYRDKRAKLGIIDDHMQKNTHWRLYNMPTKQIWAPGKHKGHKPCEVHGLFEASQHGQQLFGQIFDRLDEDQTGFLSSTQIRKLTIPPRWYTREQKEEALPDLEVFFEMDLDSVFEVSREEFIDFCMQTFPTDPHWFEVAVGRANDAAWDAKGRKVAAEEARKPKPEPHFTKQLHEPRHTPSPRWSRSKAALITKVCELSQNLKDNEQRPRKASTPRPRSCLRASESSCSRRRGGTSKEENNPRLEETVGVQLNPPSMPPSRATTPGGTRTFEGSEQAQLIPEQERKRSKSCTNTTPRRHRRSLTTETTGRKHYMAVPLPFTVLSKTMPEAIHAKYNRSGRNQGPDICGESLDGTTSFKDRSVNKISTRTLDNIPRTVVKIGGEFEDILDYVDKAARFMTEEA